MTKAELQKLKNQELELMESEIASSKTLKIESSDFEDIKTLTNKYSGADENVKFKLAPGQRKPLCANLYVLYMMISCILRGEIPNFPNIIVGICNDFQYIVDGLQRLSLLNSFILGEIAFRYIPKGINQKPQKTEKFFDDLSPEQREMIRNAKLEVRYIVYPSLNEMKEAIYCINTTSTPMSCYEKLAIFSSHEISIFLEKFDRSCADAYKFANTIPLKRKSSINSDRSQSLALNVEFFMISMFANYFKENIEKNTLKGSLTNFVRDNMCYQRTDFSYGKKAYKEIRKVMDQIAAESCDNNACRYRAMWITLTKVYADGNIGIILNNISKVKALLNCGSIWDTCTAKVTGNTTNFNILKPLIDHLNKNIFDTIIDNFDWSATTEFEISSDIAKELIEDENILLTEMTDSESIA